MFDPLHPDNDHNTPTSSHTNSPVQQHSTGNNPFATTSKPLQQTPTGGSARAAPTSPYQSTGQSTSFQPKTGSPSNPGHVLQQTTTNDIAHANNIGVPIHLTGTILHSYTSQPTSHVLPQTLTGAIALAKNIGVPTRLTGTDANANPNEVNQILSFLVFHFTNMHSKA